jgi:hypothetical protein
LIGDCDRRVRRISISIIVDVILDHTRTVHDVADRPFSISQIPRDSTARQARRNCPRPHLIHAIAANVPRKEGIRGRCTLHEILAAFRRGIGS